MARFADRLQHLSASEIREILKVTENPEIISFAGGLPAPELFPVEEMKRVSLAVLEEEGERVLQYTTTEGYGPLREWIANRMAQKLQTTYGKDDILLTHGSQQGLDLSGKVFLNKGDVVLCESPTYLAAISAFKAYECQFIAIETDTEGMKLENLEEVLATTPAAKLIYVIPDFQNPTGRTWSLERRKGLMALCSRYDIVVIEDNPYGELRFEGAYLPSLQAFDTKGQVVTLGTFSKTFCPGYRIGWTAASKEILSKYIVCKQGADLQCNTIAQREIAKYLELYDIDAHIEKIREVYRTRRDLALSVMAEYFPSWAKFHKPEGGLFVWVELPSHMNAREIFKACIAEKVAFVPGGPFFPNGGNENTLRLNFSNMPEDRIVEGMKRLGNVLHTFSETV